MFRLVNKLKNRKGFTLIELIVVLAVLAVIMAIAIPRFMGVQETAKKNADKSSLEMIAKSGELWYIQTESTASSTAISSLIPDYLDTDIKFESDTYDSVTSSSLIEFNSTGGVTKVGGFAIPQP